MDRSGSNSRKTPLLVITLILLICSVIFKDYLLFQKFYFFEGVGSDTLNYNYPFLYNVAGHISTYGIPKWSFGLGMGQSLFPFFLRDPFDIFLYLAGKDHILYGMVYKEVAKILLSGFIFFHYLKLLKLSAYTSLAGSLLFAFCGFMILGSCWNIFSFEAFNLTLLLLSFELLFTRRNWLLFPLSVFLICISQPFNLYLYGVFLFFYAILRHVQTKTFTAKAMGFVFLQMFGLAVLGMLISAPFLIENVIRLIESPRGSGNNSVAHTLLATPKTAIAEKIEIGAGIMRFFSTDLLGNGRAYNVYRNYLEVPLFYCGLPCLLLVPQVFQFLERRVKVFFIVFLAIWFLPLSFPYLRYAFWLFTGDYYRTYSFFVAVLILYYSVHALELINEKRKINIPVLLGTVVILFILLYYPFSPSFKISLDHSVLLFISIMLPVYCIILYLMSRQNAGAYPRYIFMIVLVAELTYLSGITVNNMEAVTASEWASGKGYNDHTVAAVKYLRSVDNSFYRIDKTYYSSPSHHRSRNDGMAQDYRGTSAYNPFNQLYYILYLQLMGISDKNDEAESRWANGLTGRPILESENRVKYVFTKTAIDSFRKITTDSLYTSGDVHVYRNKYVLPFGYTYKYYVRESVFSVLSNDQKDLISLKACVLKDGETDKAKGLKEYLLKDTIAINNFNTEVYRQHINELSLDTLVTDKFDENLVKGSITVAESKMLYLSIPYDAGWKLTVDGHEQDKVILNGGMTGVMLNKGYHTLELSYHLRFFSGGLLLSLLGLLLYAGLWIYSVKHRPHY